MKSLVQLLDIMLCVRTLIVACIVKEAKNYILRLIINSYSTQYYCSATTHSIRWWWDDAMIGAVVDIDKVKIKIKAAGGGGGVGWGK